MLASVFLMLYTDGNFITSDDMTVIDPEIMKTAAAELIIVDNSPQSIITQSLGELSAEITSRFQNFSGYLVGVGYTANHLAAVLNVLSTAINRPRARMNQIVAIGPDPTKSQFQRYAVYYCLHAFYRSAFHRKLNDRYEKKMGLYKEETDRAWANLKYMGMPIVTSPLPCPGATLEYQSGTWGCDNVTATGSGSTDTGSTYYVAITWVNSANYASPTAQNQGESGPSMVATVPVGAGQFVSVSIATLNPPSGSLPQALGTSDGIYNPQPATGWNIYVGLTKTAMWLQNATPVPIATKTSTLTVAPLTSGSLLNQGQFPEYNYALSEGMVWRA